MIYSIEWSPQSVIDYENSLIYLQKEWGRNSVVKFNKEFKSALNRIATSPELFSTSRRLPTVRKCVLRKQVSIFYRIKGKNIELVSIFDNRQNPDNLSRKTE